MPSLLRPGRAGCEAVAAVFCLLASGLWVKAEQRGRMDNRSYTTLCAEVDNVDVPLVCPGIQAYRITAVHPRYNPTSISASGVDFSDCPEFSDGIWLIGNKDGQSSEFKQSGFTNEYVHYAPDDPPAGVDQAVSNMPVEINNDWVYDHRIRFTAEQVGDFNIEKKFGSTLTVRMALVSSDPWQADPAVEIRVLTWSTNGWTDQGTQIFRTNNLTGVWNIPDLTWLDGVDTNVIRLRVVRQGEGGATKTNCYARYDYLELKRRAHKGSNNGHAPVLYEDGNIKVDAVWEDYWVNYPEEMRVDVVGGSSIPTCQYVRITKRVPGKTYSNEVFVLYQNAYARIIPLPPTNLWGVPYGASVILGPTTNEPRPNAHIDRVTIDPQDLSVDVEYLDGTMAHLELRVDRESHIVDVSGITYDTLTNAATRFRSMWVYDGKADIDRIQSERGTYPILHGWTSLTGTWWHFYEEVPSYHNTYCPEFRLEILGTNQGFLVREAEAFDSVASGTVVACSGAYGGAALLMATGGAEAVYHIALTDAAPGAILRIRYADADGGDGVDNLGHTIRVIVDGTSTAQTYSVDTGGTNEFELSPSLVLGDLAAGDHVIRIQTGAGTGGIILDWFELVAQPVRAGAAKTIKVQQGETLWWAHPPQHLHWVDRPTAISNMALHVEGTNEPWTTVGYYISNSITRDYDHVFLRLRYSDDVPPNQIYVLVDDVTRARFGTEDTGWWDDYTNFYPIYLGALTTGTVQIMFRITNANWGVDLDEFELYTINWPPEIGLEPYRTLPVGSSTSFPVRAHDENGDGVVVSNAAAPTGASFDGTNFSWTALPPSVAGTTNAVAFVADDQQGLSNSVVTNLAWIVVPYDGDGDALGDGWEWTFFTSLVQEAAGDYDGDGSDHFTEQVAGTSPTDSNSFFRATAVASFGAGGGCAVTVGTEPGRKYEISYADASFANDIPWTPFASTNAGVWIETGTVSSTHTFIDDEGPGTTGGAPAGGLRHYRVKVGKTGM